MNQHVTVRSKRKPWWTDVNRATFRPSETSRAPRSCAFIFSASFFNVATNFSLKCQCYGQASLETFCRRSPSGPFSLFLLYIQNICSCSALCLSNPEVPLFPLVLLFIVCSLRKSSTLIDIALAKNLLFLNTKQDVEIWWQNIAPVFAAW